MRQGVEAGGHTGVLADPHGRLAHPGFSWIASACGGNASIPRVVLLDTALNESWATLRDNARERLASSLASEIMRRAFSRRDAETQRGEGIRTDC
jgi:hypothetical protein